MIKAFIRTLVSYMLFGMVCWVFLVPVFLLLVLPEKWRQNNYLIYQMTRFFYWITLKVTLISIAYKGLHNLPDEPTIFVANHQSALDIPLVGLLAGGKPHVWMAKQELTNSFFLRYLLPKTAILVDSTTKFSAMRSLLTLIKQINAGMCRHIMIFPEGARYTDGTIHDFFSGFTVIAKESKRPIVPVYIHNVGKVYPPGSFVLHDYPIEVRVGEPLYFEHDEADDVFKKRVYTWFTQQVIT